MFLCKVPQREKCCSSVWILPHFDESMPHCVPWDLSELQHMETHGHEHWVSISLSAPRSLESQGCVTEQSGLLTGHSALPLSPSCQNIQQIQQISCEQWLQQGVGTEIEMSEFKMFRCNKRIINGLEMEHTPVLSLVLWVMGSAGVLSVLPNTSFRQEGNKVVGSVLVWAIHLKVGLNHHSGSLQLWPSCDSVILQLHLLCTVWASSLLSFLLFCLLTVLLI